MKVGAYEVEAEIGRGAMGVVYRVRHGPTGALRALKMLSGEADRELLARFRREAEALARVAGEGIVPVHEAGVEKGRLYIVLGLMPGGSLEARLKARGRLEWREAAALVAKLARALDRCHEAGIIHRDVKPANVLFDEEDRPCLADFGLARDLDAVRLTVSGTVIGSPAFMPPEQINGEKVGPSADVYALGVTLHLLVTGELPFKSRNALELLLEKRERTPPSASAAAGTTLLDAPIARAVAASPAKRTRSAAELAAELEATLAGRTAEKRRARGAAIPLVALAAVAVALAVFASRNAAKDAAPPEGAGAPLPVAARPLSPGPIEKPRPSPETPAVDPVREAIRCAREAEKLAAAGDFAGAVAALDTAIALDGAKTELHIRRGELRLELDVPDTRGARGDIAPVLSETVSMWSDRARAIGVKVLALEGAELEARALVESVVDPALRAQLADYCEACFSWHPNRRLVLDLTTKSIALRPREAELWLSRGRLRIELANKGDRALIEPAIEDLTRAIELGFPPEKGSQTVDAHLRRAEAFALEEDMEHARGDAAEAVRLAPERQEEADLVMKIPSATGAERDRFRKRLNELRASR